MSWICEGGGDACAERSGWSKALGLIRLVGGEKVGWMQGVRARGREGRRGGRAGRRDGIRWGGGRTRTHTESSNLKQRPEPASEASDAARGIISSSESGEEKQEDPDIPAYRQR